FNPVADNIETLNRFPNIKNNLLDNLKYTHGDYNFIKKFEKTLPGQRFLCGGYDHNRVEIILRKYKKIVKMRNSIAHSLPHNINGKYVKIHRSIDKNKIAKDVVVDEAFLAEFIEECNELIEIFSNPDFNSVVQEFVVAINEHLNIVRSAVSKFNLASNIAPSVSFLAEMADLTKKISEEPTSHQHKQ
ncbi:MAG: hypothetical protein Q4A23_00010, partial [bacterium]|nr:hypothetical protein [bacterium]